MVQNTMRPIGTTRPQKRQSVEDLFSYTVFFDDLAASSTQNGNIQIQADSDFKWIKGQFFADIAGAPQTADSLVIPLVTVQITDSGSGRQLNNEPVPVSSLFGSGQLPYINPIPRIFKARSNIAFQVANFSAATTYDLRLVLTGTKVFEYGDM